MSGFTKPELKALAKSGDLTTILLANEVLTLRELAGEARKDARRAAEEMEQSHNSAIELAIGVVSNAVDWNDALDKLQALKEVE